MQYTRLWYTIVHFNSFGTSVNSTATSDFKFVQPPVLAVRKPAKDRGTSDASNVLSACTSDTRSCSILMPRKHGRGGKSPRASPNYMSVMEDVPATSSPPGQDFLVACW